MAMRRVDMIVVWTGSFFLDANRGKNRLRYFGMSHCMDKARLVCLFILKTIVLFTICIRNARSIEKRHVGVEFDLKGVTFATTGQSIRDLRDMFFFVIKRHEFELGYAVR